MADGSKIEWTDATWNIITGCSIVSPGCTNCYAMKLAGTRLRNHPSRQGLTDPSAAGPVWNGQVRFNEDWIDQPRRWDRPRKIFVCAHGDLFHPSVPDMWIDRVFDVAETIPRHIYQILTKRPERMLRYLEMRPQRKPRPHIWLGFSAEDQKRFDERWRHVEPLAWAGWLTWLSAEPLLGQIDATAALWSFRPCPDCPSPDPEKGISEDCCREPEPADGLKWVVAGGESGPGARPAHPDWFRVLRDDSITADVPFMFKQNGDWVSVSEVEGEGEHYSFPDGATVRRIGKAAAGRTLDGRTWDEFPAMEAT